jgi:hypothetical protein
MSTPELSMRQHRAMGFKIRGFVFADCNPPFTGEDLEAALQAVQGGHTYEIRVPVSAVGSIRVAVSKIEILPKSKAVKKLDIGDSSVSDWRFEGTAKTSGPLSWLHGRTVRAYAVGGHNLGGKKDVVDLYTQVD